jgi:predicted aspartyl protease
VDSGASAPVVGQRLATKLGVWKRARKVLVKQGDGSHLSGGNFVINTGFKVFSSGMELGKFSLDAEVLDIGKKDVVLGLSWLKENGFVVDPVGRCLRNISTGLVIPCSVR